MKDQFDSEGRCKLLWGLTGAGALLVVASVVLLGCKRSQSSMKAGRNEQFLDEQVVAMRNEAFDYAIDTINRLEEFDTEEMLKQAIDRLDGWVQDQEPLADWKPDPMLDTLPAELHELPVLDELGKLRFSLGPPSYDGIAFQEAVWLRDLSDWARGSEVGDVERAAHLFDWTVRNIQLDAEPSPHADGQPSRVMRKPWEILLLGRGTADERAWVFTLLARNQGLDAVMIGPTDSGQSGDEDSQPRLVGVLSRNELYLFDPLLGLPVPSPEGPKLDKAGRLAIEPATLAQVVADDGLLRRLDLDPQRSFPLESDQLRQVVAHLEASPTSLSQRMKLVEMRLAGSDRLVLTADPSGQAERIRQCRHVAQTRLWPRPFETALQESRLGPERQQWQAVTLTPFRAGIDGGPTLLKGRSLHLRGTFSGEPGATYYYQLARPSNTQLASANIPPQIKTFFLQAKLNASYWQGLIAEEEGNDRAAADYFAERVLKTSVDGPWTHGAVYNLARIYEGSNVALAVGLYVRDDASPSNHGNMLRARWLATLNDATSDKPPQPDSDEPVQPKAAKQRADGSGGKSANDAAVMSRKTPGEASPEENSPEEKQ